MTQDQHPVSHLGHHTHIMGDEQNGHAKLGLKRADQMQDLGLGRDIKCGRRFIGDQHSGLAGQSHGDHHPLAQPT